VVRRKSQSAELFVLVGPTFGAVCYISGTRQGRTVLYRENCYPFHALGDVTFLWRPAPAASESDDSHTRTRQLWIWTHPSSYTEIFTELKKVFHLTEADCSCVPVSSGCDVRRSEETVPGKRKRKKKKNNASCPKRPKLVESSAGDMISAAADSVESSAVIQDAHCKMISELSDRNEAPSLAASVSEIGNGSRDTAIKDSGGVKTIKCGDQHLLSKTELVRNVYENDSVRLESLKDELCRFRLIGPKSHQVIVEALHLAEASSMHRTENVDEGRPLSGEVIKCWSDDYVVSEHGLAEVAQQADSWNKLTAVQNAAELPSSSVHGLIVRDPRLFLPQHRTSVSCSVRGECMLLIHSLTGSGTD